MPLCVLEGSLGGVREIRLFCLLYISFLGFAWPVLKSVNPQPQTSWGPEAVNPSSLPQDPQSASFSSFIPQVHVFLISCSYPAVYCHLRKLLNLIPV